MTRNVQRKGDAYIISNVKAAGDGNGTYIVTVSRSGKFVSDVRVATTSSSAAYFYDVLPPRTPKEGKAKLREKVTVKETAS